MLLNPACLLYLLQETKSQRAAAALSAAATEEEDPNMDADVASESAALQSRCKRWITGQKASQHKQTGSMRGNIKQIQHVQGSSQQSENGRRAFLRRVLAIWDLCVKLCTRQGTAEQPQGNRNLPPQPQSEQAGIFADSDYNVREQDQMQDGHYAALDASGIVSHANNSASRDAGHLQVGVAHAAVTKEVNTEDALAETTAQGNEPDNSYTTIKLDQISNHRCVC